MDESTEKRRGFTRPLRVLGSPSALGIRPYEEGGIQELWKAPRRLRELGLIEALGAVDRGDLRPPPYLDLQRRPGAVRNERGLEAYCRELGRAVAAECMDGNFLLLLAGECSATLGALLGSRLARPGRIGLVYVDAHADFARAENSGTGSAAGMALALAVGVGEGPLARLNEAGALVEPRDVVLVGRRDEGEEEELKGAGIRELDDKAIREGATGSDVLAVLGADSMEGFWIHVDLDILDPAVFPAVYVKTPGGLGFDELGALLAPLVRHPRALGMHLALYDPRYDSDGRHGLRLLALLARLFDAGRDPCADPDPVPGC